MMRELEDALNAKAQEKFGSRRTEELKADIAKLAAELQDVSTYPLTIEDEL